MFQLTVRLPDGTEKVWNVNNTTLRALKEAYGDESKEWVGKKVRVEVREQVVRGVPRRVIYGYPVAEARPAREQAREELAHFIEKLRGMGLKAVSVGELRSYVKAVVGEVSEDDVKAMVQEMGLPIDERGRVRLQ